MIAGPMTLVLCTLICLGAFTLQCECSNGIVPNQPTYQYFGTKTIYNDAAKYMKTERASDLPKAFSHKSLKEINDDLIEKNCSPVNLYFIGRHAARFPDRKEIIEFNNYIQELKSKLEPLVNESGYSSDVKVREQLKAWEWKMKPEQADLITDLGEKEEMAIAQRIRALYPKFFSNKSADITIAVTDKIRTQQTAAAFLRAIGYFSNTGSDTFPTNDITDPQYSTEAILDSEVYKALEKQYKRSDLMDFHTECRNIRKKSLKPGQVGHKEISPLAKKVKNPDNLNFILDSVQKRLGVPNLTLSDLKKSYNLCRYEMAIKGSSIWCSLFDENQLRVFEYINDMNTYLSSYGPKINSAQACPVVKDLLLSFEKTTKDNDKGSCYDDDKQLCFKPATSLKKLFAAARLLRGGDKHKLTTQLYFTHATALKRLLAAFGLFKDEDNLGEKAFDEFLESKIPPSDRQWRSTIGISFSANLAFYLYKCDKRDGPEYKMVTSVSENPVKINGCSHTVCDFDEFVESYKSALQCDLNEICSAKADQQTQDIL